MFKSFFLSTILAMLSGCATYEKVVYQESPHKYEVVRNMYLHYASGQSKMVFSEGISLASAVGMQPSNRRGMLSQYNGAVNILFFVNKKGFNYGHSIQNIDGQYKAYYAVAKQHVSNKLMRDVKENFAPMVVEISNSLAGEENWRIYDVSQDMKSYQWVKVNNNCEGTAEYDVKNKKWSSSVNLNIKQSDIINTVCAKLN